MEEPEMKLLSNLFNLFFMKKLLFAIGSIAAMLIVSSCSDDSLDDVKKENAINKKEISPSAITTTVLQDTIPNNSIQQVDEEPIDGGNPVR